LKAVDVLTLLSVLETIGY